MGLKDLKIVIWCGAAPNQKALACKIASTFNVAGVVIDAHHNTVRRLPVPKLLSKFIDRFRFRKIYEAWKKLMTLYNSRYPQWPDVSILRVDHINTEATLKFTDALRPDLIVVSGTALIKKPLLTIKSTAGIINLHTGVSPYVKGGPNCTNWCIANNEWHLIGNTIMWLGPGIDSGNIITSETIDIREADDLAEAHYKVMEHAHELYLRTITYLSKAEPPYQSIPQQHLGKGNLYLTRMWTAKFRGKLIANWEQRNRRFSFPPVKTVSLPED